MTRVAVESRKTIHKITFTLYTPKKYYSIQMLESTT